MIAHSLAAPHHASAAADAVKAWAPDTPSTLDGYVDRWTEYLVADPSWREVFFKTQALTGGLSDPAAHRTFCQRLATALVPPDLAGIDPDRIRCWGPAPPSTLEDYVTCWGRYLSALLARSRDQQTPIAAPLVAPPRTGRPDAPEAPKLVHAAHYPLQPCWWSTWQRSTARRSPVSSARKTSCGSSDVRAQARTTIYAALELCRRGTVGCFVSRWTSGNVM
jgi:hypothetical protein